MFTIHNTTFDEDRIFLLSHMRSCSTLIAHILGNNPAINGYYEMRQNYNSISDLTKQRESYLLDHIIKPNSQYLLDKIVFNQYHITTKFLNSFDPKIIISIGSPMDTIPSMMEMSNSWNAYPSISHQYISRIRMLYSYSTKFKGKFLFIDATDIIDRTTDFFAYIEHYLNLDVPLSNKYKTYCMSEVQGTGDRSSNLKLGIINSRRSHSKSTINMSYLMQLEAWYQKTRLKILANGKANTFYDPNKNTLKL